MTHDGVIKETKYRVFFSALPLKSGFPEMKKRAVKSINNRSSIFDHLWSCRISTSAAAVGESFCNLEGGTTPFGAMSVREELASEPDCTGTTPGPWAWETGGWDPQPGGAGLSTPESLPEPGFMGRPPLLLAALGA